MGSDVQKTTDLCQYELAAFSFLLLHLVFLNVFVSRLDTKSHSDLFETHFIFLRINKLQMQ